MAVAAGALASDAVTLPATACHHSVGNTVAAVVVCEACTLGEVLQHIAPRKLRQYLLLGTNMKQLNQCIVMCLSDAFVIVLLAAIRLTVTWDEMLVRIKLK